MTEITMDIQMAEAASAGLAQNAEELRQTRTLMNTQARTVVDVWQCDAELEFQDLHDKLLIELDKKIEALDEIRKGLDKAIYYARIADQSFE